MVSWNRVQRPLQYGGLSIHDLELQSWALRIGWLWMQKTDASRPWEGLPIEVPRQARAMFQVAVATIVGNGQSTKFWTDRWLHGQTIQEIAPHLFDIIPKRFVKQRTVAQGLTDRAWVADIQGALTVQIIIEDLRVWDLVEGFSLQQHAQDKHTWRFTQSGVYSSKSAYEAFFLGTIRFAPWKGIWKTWSPPRCKFFLWLAINNRCWTAERLAKRNLPHPSACPLCDQAEETMDHLLISRVFAREVWALVFQKLNLLPLAPQPSVGRFSS